MRSRRTFTLAAVPLFLAIAAPGCGSSPDETSPVDTPIPTDVAPVRGVRATDLGLDPSDAYSMAGGPLPDHAVLTSVAEFKRSYTAKSLPRFLGPKQRAADYAAAGETAKQDEATIAEFLSAHPDRPDIAALINAAPSTDDPGVRALPTGDYEIEVVGRKGETHVFQTMGTRARHRMIADALRVAPTRANQEAVYTHIYENFSGAADAGLPSPASLSKLGAADLDSSIRTITAMALDYVSSQPIPHDVPLGYVAECNQQEGFGNGGDGSDYDTVDRSAIGLFNTVDWTNKYFTTCVKNQSSRGSCAIFTFASMLEMAYAKQTHRWVNLSEQHLYAAYRTTWNPDDYAEWQDPMQLARGLYSSGYKARLEKAWDYNRSSSRRWLSATSLADSCVDYNEKCSETVHQADRICMRLQDYNFCWHVLQEGPITDAMGSSDVGHIRMTNYLDRRRAMDQLILTLAFAQRPVLVGINIGNSWRRVNNDGYMDGFIGGMGGGHGIHVVAFVPNEQLPAGAPRADGPGYFVAKNSWGTAVADGGYYYVPYSWLLNYAIDIVGLRF